MVVSVTLNTILESPFSNACHTVGDGNRSQARAITESTAPNAYHGVSLSIAIVGDSFWDVDAAAILPACDLGTLIFWYQIIIDAINLYGNGKCTLSHKQTQAQKTDFNVIVFHND